MITKINHAIQQAKLSSLYKDKLKNIDSISSIEHMQSIPFTTKQDLRDSYPYGGLAVNPKNIIEVHTTSGTTGDPTLSFYTKKDLMLTNAYISKAWKNFGINKNSRVQFMMGYGLFSGAALNTYAIQSLGGFVIPSGIQSMQRQVEMLKEFKVDTVVSTPSYLLRLYEYMHHNNISLNELSLKTGIAAGEVYSDKLKNKLSKLYNIKIFDHYGLCEVNTGIIYECNICGRMATIKDYVHAEIVDPNSNCLLPNNQYGELVLTATMKEASPIIRYRTGDIASIIESKSKCKQCKGSTIISRIKGRLGDDIFYKGLILNPYDIRDYIILESRKQVIKGIKIVAYINSDDIVEKINIILTVHPSMANKDYQKYLESKLQSKTMVHFNIEFVYYDKDAEDTVTKSKLVEYARI